MNQTRSSVSIQNREIVILYPDNYSAWAESIKKRSYQFYDAGRLIREFDITTRTYLYDRKYSRSNVQDNRPSNTEIEEDYLTINGAAGMMTDMLTSISKESELKLRANPLYRQIEISGKFLHLWELIYTTHSERRSMMVIMRNLINISQNGMTVEDYICKFEKLLEECGIAGEALTEAQTVGIFLNGLNFKYQEYITSWEINGLTPKTYIAAKERILSTRRILDNRVRDPKKEKDATKVIKCFNCGKVGHKSYNCKAQPTTKTRGSNGFTGAVLLDSGASISLCNDERRLRNVKKSDKRIKDANGNFKNLEKSGSLFGIRDVYHNPDCPHTILSMGQMKEQGFHVTYSNDIDSFEATKNGQKLIFENNDGLYHLKRKPKTEEVFLVQNEVKILHEVLGHPGKNAMMKMAKHVPSLKISEESISKNWTKCEQCVKGKMVELPSISNEHHPEAQIGEILHCDIMYFGLERKKYLFLICIDHKSGYIHSILLNDKSGKSLFVAIETIVNFYISFKWKPRTIMFDQDSAITSVEDRINKMELNLILRAPFRHEKNVERWIRSIKDCARTIIQNLCAEEEIPEYEFLIPEVISQAVRLINIRPNVRSGESYPREMVTGIQIKDRELKHAFGEKGFCKIQSPRSDVEPRAEEAIFLGAPADTLGYRVLLVKSRRIVDRHDFTKKENQVNVVTVEENKMKKDAIMKECESMMTLKVFNFVNEHEVDKSKLVNSFLFTKIKYKADGSVDKWKSRLVARGDEQDVDPRKILRADTVDKKCMFSLLNVALQRDWKVVCTDIPSAYLHAEIDESVYMRINGEAAEYYGNSYPELKQKMDQRGNIYVKLNKSLYGLRQAGRLWMTELGETLLNYGLKKSISEPQIYIGDKMIILVHVDDLMIIYQDQGDLSELKSCLEKYGTITFQTDRLQYLGMQIEKEGDKYLVSQVGYIKKLLMDYSDLKTRKYPMTIEKSYVANESKIDKSKYLSDLMKLMYLGKMTRPDIAFGCTYLTTFCNDPMEEQRKGIENILGYLKLNQHFSIKIGASEKIEMYCDASYNTYRDGKGHSGCLIKYGGSILWTSKKQKHVAGSTFEAELNSLYTGIAYLLEVYNFVMEIGAKTSVKIFEDNQAVISVLKNGTGANGTSKYLNVKINYICEIINRYDFELIYIETKKQIADILTKPICDKTFYDLKSLL